MKYIVSINNKTYEVEVEKGQATVLKAAEHVAPVAQPAIPPVSAPVSKTAPAPSGSPAPSVDGEKVLAPMPGAILNVKVHPGATIKKGEVLLVLEAMKMENEVVSPRDGTVAYAIPKGTHVSTGDVLVVIK